MCVYVHRKGAASKCTYEYQTCMGDGDDRARCHETCRSSGKVFLHLDKDNSGTVSREELQNIDQADHKILAEATAISDPLDIFLALDVDNRGLLAASQ